MIGFLHDRTICTRYTRGLTHDRKKINDVHDKLTYDYVKRSSQLTLQWQNLINNTNKDLRRIFFN